MNLDDYSTVEDNQRYINPQVSLDEQNAFIKNLREVQSADTAQIAQETHDLGTDVPSNLGGLTGSEGYFASRYQTPQTNALVADLRAAAQAQALNDAMSNELAKAKRRYSNAYRAAQKRARSSYYPSTNTNPDVTTDTNPEVDWGDTNEDIDKVVVGGITPAMSLPSEEWLAKREAEEKKRQEEEKKKRLNSLLNQPSNGSISSGLNLNR